MCSNYKTWFIAILSAAGVAIGEKCSEIHEVLKLELFQNHLLKLFQIFTVVMFAKGFSKKYQLVMWCHCDVIIFDEILFSTFL